MSEVAKDRLLAVGTRFSSYEHQNSTKNIPVSHVVDSHQIETSVHPLNNQQVGGKMSFWKKNSGKVPGRYSF